MSLNLFSFYFVGFMVFTFILVLVNYIIIGKQEVEAQVMHKLGNPNGA